MSTTSKAKDKPNPDRPVSIVYMDIGEITPYKKNPRKIPQEAVDGVAESIREFGFKVPIVVDKDNVVVTGHTRLKAAEKLGLFEVPCIVADELTPQQIKAFRVADNQLNTLTSFDDELLLEELGGIMEIDMGLFGFEFEDDEATEVVDDNFDVTSAIDEIDKPVVKLGEIYKLGRHRLMCGDSTDNAFVAALMGNEKAEAAFTDPPWNVNYGASDHPSWKQRTIMNDSMTTEQFKEFLNKSFKQLAFTLLPGGMAYIVMSAQEWGSNMQALEEEGFHWSSTIIWNKDRIVLSRKDYHTKYEPIWYGWKNDGPRLCPLKDRKQSDVWDFERPSRSDEHPTMKPVPLVAKAIKNSSSKNDKVVDLFGGSGTTLIAAEQLGRTCFMMELDPKYVQVIIERFLNNCEPGEEVYRIEKDGAETPWEAVKNGG